jgi:alpha-D-ribose 1-methylphosphonate 5-triphosphate synthase subunit PhnG
MQRWQTSAMNAQPADLAARQAALAILALVKRDALETAIGTYWPKLSVRDLKPAETGLVMLRGRIGGDGAPFNVGEATVSRAVIELGNGKRGFGHVLGRDCERARLVAIADALWQSEDSRSQVDIHILAPARATIATEKQKRASEAAATKVDFFTLVRGED